MTTRRSPIAVLPALVLVTVAAWETCAAGRDAQAVPGDGPWQRAAGTVRDSYRPGDLIVFAPRWIDPIGRLHLGDLMTLDMAARMDAARYDRIWELSIRGARAPETEGLTPVASREDDGVTVRRFERPPAQVVADLHERLATARFDGGGAQVTLAEVGFEPHRCIQVVPVPYRAVRVTFPQVPLGKTLVGYVGLADVFTRRDVRAPGAIGVQAGDASVAVAAGVDDGWVRFELQTTPGAADVVVTAFALAPNRQICFAAEARR